MGFSEALNEYKGELAVLIDPDFGEGAGRGIFFRSARGTTTQDVRIMASRAGGICTVTIDEPTAMRLQLNAQGKVPADADIPYFTSSVESLACTETGISAGERAITMSTLGAPDVSADQITSPGHVMVEVARNIFRSGATLSERAYMLMSARTNTRFPGWCDILDEKGEIASADHCHHLAISLDLSCYGAGEVEVFGRRELADWLRAVEFSKTRYPF